MLTDPLTHVTGQMGDNLIPWVSHELVLISEFPSDIRHILEEKNAVADTLSRGDGPSIMAGSLYHSPTLNYTAVAAAQDIKKLQALCNDPTSPQLVQHRLVWNDTSISPPPVSLAGLLTPPLLQSSWHHRDATYHQQASGVARDEKRY